MLPCSGSHFGQVFRADTSLVSARGRRARIVQRSLGPDLAMEICSGTGTSSNVLRSPTAEACMFTDVLKHLGKLLQQLLAPVEEPMHCPRCNRKNALLLTAPSDNPKAVGWKCQFCNHMIAK